MKRLFVAIAALALALGACTRTIVRQEEPVVSPAAVDPSVDVTDDPVVRLIERVRPAVVNITTDTIDRSSFGEGGGRGVGSGFIVRADGIVVTNYHVVEGAQRITVITPEPDAQRYEARVIGGDQAADLAVLKIGAQGLPTIPMGASVDLKLGQQVVAIGYALALEGGPTVTQGIVSALDRSIDANDPNCAPDVCGEDLVRTYSNVIQTDAAINPGNSGGPLLNLTGEVVGINSAGAGAAENIGFAIAIDAAKPTIESAAENPSEPVAYLGVVTQDVTEGLSFQFALPVTQGAYVVDLAPRGPAESAGVDVGEVIVEFEGKEVADSESLGDLIRTHDPGDRVELVVVGADGDRRTATATLGVNPVPVPQP
jgi:S1-C subfamily serine protease